MRTPFKVMLAFIIALAGLATYSGFTQLFGDAATSGDSDQSATSHTDIAHLKEFVAGKALLISLKPNGESESWADSSSGDTNGDLTARVFRLGNGFIQACYVSAKNNSPHLCSPSLEIMEFGNPGTSCFGNKFNNDVNGTFICVSDEPQPGDTLENKDGYEKMIIPAGVPFIKEIFSYGEQINHRFLISRSASHAEPPA